MKIFSLPYTSSWLPVLIGVLLLPVPLLGNFHVESALLAALVGCFWAGISACHLTDDKGDWRKIGFILRSIYLTGLPLFIFALITDCFGWNGLGFWLLYPVPSVLFGYAFGRMLRYWHLPYRKTLTVAFLLIVAIVIPLIEFFNLPQVYFFNHVWGGWPGPIYDETITISLSLILFRVFTLLWVGLFWSLASVQKSTPARIAAIFIIAYAIAGYSFLPQMGIISPRSYIQKQLEGVKRTSHFIIYYEKSGYTKDELALTALESEFYFKQITEALNIHHPDKKIEIYLYANVKQKNQLTGAKFTSYVPVWLQQDQLHIAKGQLGSLKHEMVHVLAKQFGNRILNASWSIGLVEGLAVALAPDVSAKSTIHQIVAAQKPWPTYKELKNALSFMGFYTESGAVSYTITGSFVRYLLKHYPVENFKTAYRNANIDKAYPQSFKHLVEGWHQFLKTVPVDSTARKIAARLFSIPSLFEQACPHVLSSRARHLQKYRLFLMNKDTSAALHELTALRSAGPGNSFVTAQWARLNLKMGHINDVMSLNRYSLNSSFTKLLMADALALKEKWGQASALVKSIAAKTDSLPKSIDRAIQIRSNKRTWQSYLKISYQNKFYNITRYKHLNESLQLLLIQKTIKLERWNLFSRYASIVIESNLNKPFIGLYLKIIHYLSFQKKFSLSERWIEKINLLTLTKRYKQRLQKNIVWFKFIKSLN